MYSAVASDEVRLSDRFFTGHSSSVINIIDDSFLSVIDHPIGQLFSNFSFKQLEGTT